MHLEERLMAVDACKWCTQSVPGAPYVTDPKVMDQYQCEYVVHGDDITTDADGNDCYRIVKEMGRFIVVKRTPNISTTDLVGRMLSHSTDHHLSPFTGSNLDSHFLFTEDSLSRFKNYASAEDGKSAGSGAYGWYDDHEIKEIVKPSEATGKSLKRKAYYVDGGFDLFFMGHIEFLKKVRAKAQAEGAAVVVGLHDDQTVNDVKGVNYPIMNLFERSLCVLQCKYVDAVVLAAPFAANETFLEALKPWFSITAIIHGPTPIEVEKGSRKVDETNTESSDTADPYRYAKQLGIYQPLGRHKYDDVSSATIVQRVLRYREQYEERQRKKGWKSQNEKNLEALEKLENKQPNDEQKLKV